MGLTAGVVETCSADDMKDRTAWDSNLQPFANNTNSLPTELQWLNAWIVCMCGEMDGLQDSRTDGLIDGWIEGKMNGWRKG